MGKTVGAIVATLVVASVSPVQVQTAAREGTRMTVEFTATAKSNTRFVDRNSATTTSAVNRVLKGRCVVEAGPVGAFGIDGPGRNRAGHEPEGFRHGVTGERGRGLQRQPGVPAGVGTRDRGPALRRRLPGPNPPCKSSRIRNPAAARTPLMTCTPPTSRTAATCPMQRRPPSRAQWPSPTAARKAGWGVHRARPRRQPGAVSIQPGRRRGDGQAHGPHGLPGWHHRDQGAGAADARRISESLGPRERRAAGWHAVQADRRRRADAGVAAATLRRVRRRNDRTARNLSTSGCGAGLL